MTKEMMDNAEKFVKENELFKNNLITLKKEMSINLKTIYTINQKICSGLLKISINQGQYDVLYEEKDLSLYKEDLIKLITLGYDFKDLSEEYITDLEEKKQYFKSENIKLLINILNNLDLENLDKGIMKYKLKYKHCDFSSLNKKDLESVLIKFSIIKSLEIENSNEIIIEFNR